MATRRPTPSPDIEALKISPEVAWYMAARRIPLPDCPPMWKTPEPRKVRGAKFDPERVDRVLQAFEQIRHTQGKWAGKPMRPDPWQVAYILAPVFGWVHPDPDDPSRLVRIIRRLFVEVPRKNGKSTLLGGLGLVLTGADGEQGAQVIAAATTKDQAGFVFKPIKDLVQRSPSLSATFKAVGFKVLHPKSGSYMQAISSVADAQHGANIHGAVIDELHVHKSPDMIDVIESGTGSRSQPLVAIITTADENKQGSIYDQRRSKIEALAVGTITEPSQYGVVWCADREDDPFDEVTWRKSNPGYGISPTKAFMRSAADSARNSPTELPRFMRLHLGIRISELVKWLPLEQWDATGQLIDDAEWQGLRAYGGLDLSTSTDFTAFALRACTADGVKLLRVLCWLPEERFAPIAKLTGAPLTHWRAAGWLRGTEGNVVDYAQVRTDIEGLVVQLGVDLFSIAYDPWNASETSQVLGEKFEMVPCRQGYATLSAPSKALERMVLGSTPAKPLIRTGGNPLLRWMADSVEVMTDANGNIRPVKPDRQKSSKRIDGIVAAIMAEREAMADEDEESSGDAYWAALLAKHTPAS